MARPTLTDLEHGQEGWDSTVNDAWDVITGGPFPAVVYATVADLPAAGSDNVNCLAFTADTDELWCSDGSAWRMQGDKGHVDANGSRAALKKATAVVTCSGASSDFASAFPAGTIMLGVALRVLTTVTGATTFDVGDGSDVDRYAAAVALAAGTTKDPSNGTATPIGWSTSATPVRLTANGSNFTGGTVRVVVYYLQLTAPTS